MHLSQGYIGHTSNGPSSVQVELVMQLASPSPLDYCLSMSATMPSANPSANRKGATHVVEALSENRGRMLFRWSRMRARCGAI